MRANLTPLIGTLDSARQFQRFLTSLRAHDLLAVEVDASALLPNDESSRGFDNVTVAVVRVA